MMPGDLCKVICEGNRISLYKAQISHVDGYHSLFHIHKNDLIFVLAKIEVEDYPVCDILVIHKKGVGWTTSDKCIKIN